MSVNTRRIDYMHRKFGKTPGMRCGDCEHLITKTHDRAYFKCEIYGISSSVATDWVKRYAACGLYNQPTAIRNVMKLLLQKERADAKVADGQLSLLSEEAQS